MGSRGNTCCIRIVQKIGQKSFPNERWKGEFLRTTALLIESSSTDTKTCHYVPAHVMDVGLLW